jgi:membrane associated rhomboid family serine protease
MILIPRGPVGAVHYKPVLTNILTVIVVAFSVVGFFQRRFLEGASIEVVTVKPFSWFTAPLVHEHVWQFLLNIIFFWLIGQLLEGRFGFWKYFGTVLVIAWTHTMSSQLFFFWMDAKEVRLEGYMQGLSAVNFGLIVVAMIYEYNRKLSFLLHLVIYQRTFEIKIMTVAILYLIATAVVMGDSGTLTDFVHLTGFAIGLFFAIFLTMAGIVPEQGANLIEQIFDKKFVRREIELNPKSESEIQADLVMQEQNEWDEALPNLTRMAAEGHFSELHNRMSVLLANNRFAKWDSELLRKLIQSYTKLGYWEEANRYLFVFQKDFPDQLTVPLLLSWTHVLLELGRPRRAMRTLQTLAGTAVRPEQKAVFRQLAERARDMVKAGVLEPDN